MTKDDVLLLGIIELLREPRDDVTGSEEDGWALELKRLSPDPEPMKYFVDLRYGDYTTQQIFDALKAYRPIVL